MVEFKALPLIAFFFLDLTGKSKMLGGQAFLLFLDSISLMPLSETDQLFGLVLTQKGHFLQQAGGFKLFRVLKHCFASTTKPVDECSSVCVSTGNTFLRQQHKLIILVGC